MRGIWVVCVFIAAMHAAAAQEGDLSALLKQQTQAFSEAGQRGDAAALDRYLDNDVVFTNETGGIATKQDLVAGAAPAPASAGKRHIEVTNWALRRQGDVATATFIDQLTLDFHGQREVLRFQSTEVWAKRAGGWKMIASQTMNVAHDPAAVSLSATELRAYVGAYQLDAGFVVRISLGADGLVASTNGAPAVALKAEIKDVLFTPGVPNLRRIFQRDAEGRVTGFISRRDGSDLVLKKVA